MPLGKLQKKKKWYTNVAYYYDYVVAGFTSEFDNRAKNGIHNGVCHSVQPFTLTVSTLQE